MPTLFDDLAAASGAVAATSKRNEKVAVLAGVLRRLDPIEIGPAVAYLTGDLPTGRIGVGWATMSNARTEPATSPSLSVLDVDDALGRLAALGGAGSVRDRRAVLQSVFERATEREQQFLVSILGGELRQGALDGVMTSAIAAAAGVPVASVRRAAMMTGDLLTAAKIALVEGRAALDASMLVPSRPVLPMLASPSADVAAALEAIGPASVEWKLDGARVQAHRAGGEVRLFTRNLNEVTDRLPGIVADVAAMPGGDLVLDGEALGVLDDGTPQRFQDTMGDFGADAIGGRGSGIRAFFFDVLHIGGSSVLDEPLSVRRELLAATVPSRSRLPSIVTGDAVEAAAFLDAAIAAGHEGVMVKDLERPYEAGRRGSSWRKVKPVYTFDLVVLAVEWGHGRRQGWLSNLHLGARSTEAGDTASFVMVGKTFKGLTDELLRWQTERFLDLEIGRGSGSDSHVVYVRPEQVVEIAIDGVQVSTRYPGGLALRFARVKRYRGDKRAADADTIDALRALLRPGS